MSSYGSVSVDKILTSAVGKKISFTDFKGNFTGSVVKAWATFSGIGGIVNLVGEGFISIKQEGTGKYVFTFNSPAPSTNYCVSVTTNGQDVYYTNFVKTQTGFSFESKNSAGLLALSEINIIVVA